MSGSSGALLQIQHALVSRFNAFASGPSGVVATFARYGLEVPLDPPPVRLYDEPPAGFPSYYRIGNASVDIETGDGRLLWSIDQELEVHVDPVRGRASALVMGDVLERAFEPTVPGDSGALLKESWLQAPALMVGQDPDVYVTEMTQVDSRIGYSEAGLTYQVITTWNIVAQPIR